MLRPGEAATAGLGGRLCWAGLRVTVQMGWDDAHVAMHAFEAAAAQLAAVVQPVAAEEVANVAGAAEMVEVVAAVALQGSHGRDSRPLARGTAPQPAGPSSSPPGVPPTLCMPRIVYAPYALCALFTP